MLRRLKRLLYTSRKNFIIYLITIVLFILSFSLFSLSLIKLTGIETLARILIIFFVILYGMLYAYKGYLYMVNKNKVKFIFLTFLTFIISLILLIVFYVFNTVYGEIDNLMEKDNTIYTGYLISLKETEKIKKAGIIDNEDDVEGYKIAKDIIKNKKLDIELKNYSSYEDMLYDLYNGVIEGAFVQSNYLAYFSSNDVDNIFHDIESKTKIVYKQSLKEKNNDLGLKNNKTLKEPFTLLLLGVDSTEDTMDAASSFNGDTLMLVTFNPHTLNATVFSIPRDLYVPIHCRKGKEAKINSSSAGGVTCVIDTIKDLTGIDVDYYAKINFKGVVDLVEALGGIDVDVTFKFCEQDSNRSFANMICLDKGFQHLNGEETLAYARHRHSLPGGDLQRIQNQQLIVEALAKRLMTLNTLTDFKDILGSISKNVVTNLSREQILSSYNILKDVVINLLKDNVAITAEKAYLEVYDLRVYNPGSNTYSAALGYYDKSLDDIVQMMRINLEKESAKPIKEFSFDANNVYEVKVAGKGLKGEIKDEMVPDFTGKMVSEVEDWASNHNIEVNIEYATSENGKYNPEIEVGLIASQNIKANSSIKNVSSITVYINSVTE